MPKCSSFLSFQEYITGASKYSDIKSSFCLQHILLLDVGEIPRMLHFWDSTFDLEGRNYLMLLGKIENPPKQFPLQRTSSFRCICFRYFICFLENALLAGINWFSVFTRPRSRCQPKKKTNPRYQSSGKTRSQI